MFARSENARLEELLGGPSLRPAEQRIELGRAVSSMWQQFAEHAGYTVRELRTRWVRAQALAAGSVLLTVATGMSILVAAIPAPFLFEYFLIIRRARARTRNFERDYPALLLSLASAIRTGLDPFVALVSARELFPLKSEMARELELLKDAVDRGVDEVGAVRSFARSIDHPDIELFRQAFVLARREGSSLGVCLERLARVTRQRQTFRRKARTAVAMQRLSGFGIAACTIIIAVTQAVSNPEAIQLVLVHPLGSVLFLAGCALVLLGLVWMIVLTRGRN